MLKRMVLGAFCVLMPTVGWAQSVPESYLPSKSQLYFRWDGMQAHQASYDKTAVGKMMQGETGVFLAELWKWTQEQGNNAARNEPKIGPLLKDLTKLIGSMYRNGLVLGIEVNRVNPPEVEALLVFPKGAGESGTLLPLIQKIGEETKADVKNAKVGKRFVHSVDIEMFRLGWWAQGEDAILYLGTTEPVDYAKNMDAKKTGITNHALYKKVRAFKEFPTCSRGYFDMTQVLDVAAEIAPPAKDIIEETGLRGIKSITFMSGFDAAGERSIVDLEMPGPRKGLLALNSSRKISLKDLPVLPNDVNSFSATAFNVHKAYDVLTQMADGIVRVFDPNKADDLKEGIKAFEGAVGVDFNKDLFGSFGDVMITYNSPSDGFLGTGMIVAFQIKDGKKLDQTLNKLIKAIPATPGGEVNLKRKSYHEGEILQLHMQSERANIHLGTFGIYKGWFLYAQYPQPIKGFILRQEGELPAWKANESLTKALAQFPEEFTAIHVSDPRPVVRTVLSITPFALNLVNTFGATLVPGYQPFDLELIPNAQEATRHLFPNVRITTDDGKRLRTETRGSLLLPF